MTSTFQGEAPGRGVAMFLAGEDDEAKQLVAGLIRDIGFEPVDLGGWAEDLDHGSAAPRRRRVRRGVLGANGQRIADALRADADQAARLALELRVTD